MKYIDNRYTAGRRLVLAEYLIKIFIQLFFRHNSIKRPNVHPGWPLRKPVQRYPINLFFTTLRIHRLGTKQAVLIILPPDATRKQIKLSQCEELASRQHLHNSHID